MAELGLRERLSTTQHGDSMGDSAESFRTSFKMQENIANGTHSVTDDEHHGFFAKGRDFESVGTAHQFTAQELEQLKSFESIEYLPPNNAVFRHYLTHQRVPNQSARWVAMGLIGSSVGFLGFLLKSSVEGIGEWRRSLHFDTECVGNITNASQYACGALDPSRIGGSFSSVYWVHLGVCLLLVAASASAVVLIQPPAASSGLPELIAFLNGAHQSKIFDPRTLVVKFMSCVMAVSSGMPVGPEGPMIHSERTQDPRHPNSRNCVRSTS